VITTAQAPICSTPPSIPDSWSGTLKEFFENYVAPWWPPPDRIAAWTEAAIGWHERPEPLLYLRGTADKGWLHQENGQRVVLTDNAPGIWILLRARDGGADPVDWPDLIEEGHLPVLKMRARGRADRPWTHAKFALSHRDTDILWSRGLKLCHIFEVRKRLGVTLIQRSLRNIALMNYFVFPNGSKHFFTERDGWSEEVNTIDLGESRVVCDYALYELAARMRTVASGLPKSFLLAAGTTMPIKPNCDLRIRVARRGVSQGERRLP
jgi:hypothetical protein